MGGPTPGGKQGGRGDHVHQVKRHENTGHGGERNNCGGLRGRGG